ncbi:MAG: YciE/YciF ferroxidase family protein [Gaiellaceae bacterium]
MSNPRDLFLQLLAEALWIEQTLAFEVLPQLHREADSELLAAPFAQHLEETRQHAERVSGVFVAAGSEPAGAASAMLEGIRKQHDMHVEQVMEPRLRDLFLVDCASRTEVVEAALYTSLIALAGPLGVDASALKENRGEEQGALRALDDVRGRLLERLGT